MDELFFFVFIKLGIQRELLARNLDGDFWG